MAINFPNSPSDGQIFFDSASGNRYIYSSAKGRWSAAPNNSPFVATSNNQVLFNNQNSIDGDNGLVFDVGANTLYANSINVSYDMRVRGNLYIGSNTVTISNNSISAQTLEVTTMVVGGSAIPTGQQSNAVYDLANAAFGQANTVGVVANAAGVLAQASFGVTNAAFTQSNNEVTRLSAAYVVANAAFGQANTLATSANAYAASVGTSTNNYTSATYSTLIQFGSVFGVANGAFGKANTALQNTTSVFGGSLTITGTVGIGTGYQSGSNYLTIGDASTSIATQVNINDNGSGYSRVFLNSQGSRSIFMQTNSTGTTSYGMPTGTVGFSQVGYSPYVFAGGNTEFLRITAGFTGIGAISLGEITAPSLITINATPAGANSGGGYYTHINGGNSYPGDRTPWLGVLNSANVTTATYGWAFYDSNLDGSLSLHRRSGSTTSVRAFSIDRGNGLMNIPGRITGNSAPVGSVIQTVFKNISGTTYYTNGGGGTRANTNITATITPQYSTSKILHIVTVGFWAICDGNMWIYRNGSQASDSLADSMRTIAYADSSVDWYPVTVQWLDSPATTSAITYALYGAATGCGQSYWIGSSGDFSPTWTMMEIVQ